MPQLTKGDILDDLLATLPDDAAVCSVLAGVDQAERHDLYLAFVTRRTNIRRSSHVEPKN